MAKRGAEEQITKDGRPVDSDEDNEEDPGVRTVPLAPVEGRVIRGMPKRKGMGGTPSAAPTLPTSKPAFAGFSFGGPSAPAPAAPAAASPSFSFGSSAPAAAAPAAAAAAAPKNPFAGFSFGSQAAAAPSTSAPAASAPKPAASGFSFGAPAAATASSTSIAPAAKAEAPKPFSFGAPAASSTPAPATAAPPAPKAAPASNGSASTSAGPSSNGLVASQTEPPSEGEVSYYTSLRGLNIALASFISSTVEKDPFVNLSGALEGLAKQYASHLGAAEKSAKWSPQGSVTGGAATSAPKPPSAMPVPPSAPTWALKPASSSQSSNGTAAPVKGGFTPSLPAGAPSASPFSFGPPATKAADVPKTAEASKPKPSAEVSKIVEDVLADKSDSSSAPAAPSNPFSFGSTPASTSTPDAKKPAPLFSFAPSGPLHQTTPETMTFTPSKSIEEASPAKLGKFGPGGSQPQLSFGGAKSSPAAQSGAPVTSKPFSFGFGASSSPTAPTAPTASTSSGSGFSFGSSSASSQPAAPASTSSTFSFGAPSSTPAPTTFSFGSATPSTAASSEAPKPNSSPFSFGSASTAAAPAPASAASFSFKPFTPTTSMSATGSSTSIASNPPADEGAAGDDSTAEPSEPSVNLAAVGGKGEESEETLYEVRARLARFAGGAWVTEGLGQMKIKKNKEDGKRRLLLRIDGTGKVVLNMGISASLNPTAEAKRATFIGVDQDGKPASYSLQVKTEDAARELVDKIKKEVEEVKNGA